MKITREIVEYSAALSRLKLDEAETEEMIKQMGDIVNYMDVLSTLDTDSVEPLSHVFNINNVMREDVVLPSHDREELLSNAPQRNEECFVVPKTVE